MVENCNNHNNTSSLSLREFVTEYLKATPDTAQIRVSVTDIDRGGQLILTTHIPLPEDGTESMHSLEIWNGIEAIEINGEKYRYWLTESLSGPQTLGSHSLYASDGIHGMDSISATTGCRQFNELVADLEAEREAPLPSRLRA